MAEKKKEFPRVLVVSHETFSANTSMGRTLTSYFNGWDRDCLAQIFIQSQVPTSSICGKFYKYTDVDALVSLVLRDRVGKILTEKDVDVDRKDATDTGRLRDIYYLGSKKKPVTYILRDWMWRHSTWHSGHLMEWVRSFRPEVIFFAAGDYVFSNDIAMTLAEELGIPLVTCCMDDYYLYNQNEGSMLGRLRQEQFRKSYEALMARSRCVFTISDQMADAYDERFGIKCRVLYTASSFKQQEAETEKRGITYLGGLEYNRNRQLVDIGRALKQLSDGTIPGHVDVYSGSSSDELVSCLTEDNGIVFHGSVSSEEVSRIIASSLAVIHTESFDENNRRLVRFSVSTKIPDSLASGTCILAYGPKDVASIRYLADNDAAFVAGSGEELAECIRTLFHDDARRSAVIRNAKALAEKNHDAVKIPDYIRSVLTEVVAGETQSST